ncbi:MAG TPA: roadblock/LC7 domain-containing protein [bacterium]|nr:roadblock/LC7 domain-containing protein [bacterium]
MFAPEMESRDASFSKEQFESVLGCLAELVEKLRVSAVLLINSSGRVLARRAGDSDQGDPAVMGALAASTYLAAGEMASMLGERSNFKMVLHEGEQHNIFISSVGEDYYLVIVFRTSVALGMVRLFARRAVGRLLPTLKQQQPATDFDALFDRHFQTLLGEELDRTFRD